MPTVRPIASFALSFLVAIECRMSVASASSVRTAANETGIGISVHADGSFEVTTRTPAWRFSGNVGSPLSHLAARRGRDRAGPYREVEFKYETSAAAARTRRPAHICETTRYRAVFERPSHVTRWIRTFASRNQIC